MSNVASALKEEISRISRKEIRRETSSLKKSSTTYRSEIAALKRRVQELERQSAQSEPGGRPSIPAAANEDSVSSGTRFSAKSMASQRKRLGSRLPNAAFSSVHRRSRSTTGRRARLARAPSTCRRSSRSGTWGEGKPRRFWRPAKPHRQPTRKDQVLASGFAKDCFQRVRSVIQIAATDPSRSVACSDLEP